MWESSLREWNAITDDTERWVARALRICVGNEVRKLYGDVPNEPIPSKIADLLHRLNLSAYRWPNACLIPSAERFSDMLNGGCN